MLQRERIRYFFLNLGCTHDDAEDLTQEVCLRLCRSGLDPETAPRSHWMRLCRLVIRDHWRRRYRERELFVPLEALSDYPAPVQEMCEDSGFMEDCLELLSGKQRRVLQMYFEQQMSPDEIAEAMGCTASAVRKLYQRAIVKLRKHFNLPDKRGGYCGLIGSQFS